MRKANLFEQLDLGSLSDSKAGRCPLSHAVDGEYGRLLKRGAEKRAGRMGEVMLAEEDLGWWDAKLSLDKVLDPELVSEPSDHGFPEDAVGAGKGLQAGQEEPFEFDERLLEKHHIV